MKKLIATVLLTMILTTISLPSLQSFFADADGYIDRNALCRWMRAAEGDRLSAVVAEGEPECPGPIPGRPLYPSGTNCVSKCEPFAIADQIIEGVTETAGAIKENVRLILGMSA